MIDSHFCFADSRMGQQGESSDIATSIHIRDGSLHKFVHFDTAAERFESQCFQTETFSYGTAAYAQQDFFTLDNESLAIFLDRHITTVYGNHLMSQIELDAPFGIFGLQHLGQFPVHRTENLIQHLDHMYFRSHAVKERGELHSDHTTSYDNQRSRQLFG